MENTLSYLLQAAYVRLTIDILHGPFLLLGSLSNEPKPSLAYSLQYGVEFSLSMPGVESLVSDIGMSARST